MPSSLKTSADSALLRGKRAVIIEDQRLFADFLAVLFQGWGIEIVCATESGVQGLAAVRRENPDLLLLDFSLPDIDGLEVARAVLSDTLRTRIIGVSSHRDPWTMLQVQRVGLHGFVDKVEQDADVLRTALVTVLGGNVFYTRAVSESSAKLRRDPRAFTRVLSDYEVKVLSLIGNAMTDEEIGAELGISPATVQSRRRDIMKKLDIHTTPKLIHFAITNGLTRPERMGGQ